MRQIKWSKYINRQILDVLKVGKAYSSNLNLIALALGYLIVCIALAGPTWQKLDTPNTQRTDALVIVFDLSPSMRATDLVPNRYSRAKLKIMDLLRARAEGQTALVAYAGSAHIVSPLTTDAKTIVGLVQSLRPEIMPVAGSNTESAIEFAIDLLNSTNITTGHILLVTDGIADAAATTVLNKFQNTIFGHRLSILGVGTVTGSPIPMENGQFLKDNNGAVVFSKLEQNILANLATRSNGRYHKISNEDKDLNYILDAKFANLQFNLFNSKEQAWYLQQNQQWQDSGAMLLLLLLPLSILALRRQILVIIFAINIALFGGEANAENATEATETNTFSLSIADKLFLNKQQQAIKLLKNGAAKKAIPMLKENTDWGAAAKFYSGDFKAAEQHYSQNKSDPYQSLNSMKALYMSRDLDSAIARAETSIELAQKNNNSNLANKAKDYKKLLEYLKQQQNQQQQQQQNQEQEQNQDQEQQEQNEQQKQEQQQQQQSEQQEQEQSEQEQQEQEQEQKQEAEKPPTEEELEQLKRMRWLENIKDDPSGFLRRKFKYQVENEREIDNDKRSRY